MTDTRTVEQRAIDEIREVLKKHNCVLGVRMVRGTGFFEETLEVKVYHASQELGPPAGVVLHSE